MGFVIGLVVGFVVGIFCYAQMMDRKILTREEGSDE